MNGHVVITAVAGRASLTVHQRIGSFCVPVVSVMLEPADVLQLANELAQAAVPPPPVVRRRIKVRRIDKPVGTWGIECPECFGVAGAWMAQPEALAAAYRHLTREHASEVSR